MKYKYIMKNTMDKQSIPENQSRRNFLVWTISHTASAALTLIPSSISWWAPALVLYAFKRKKPKKTQEDIQNRFPNEKNIQETVWITQQEEGFTNIGVLHIRDIQSKQFAYTKMGEVIENSDIILHEKGSYFNNIVDLYPEKDAFNIDKSNAKISRYVWNGATAVSSLMSIYQLKFDFLAINKDKEDKKEVRKKWLKYIIATLGISHLSMFPPSFIYGLSFREDKEDEYDFMYDISHIGDGRTVFMALEVLKYQEKYPDKKIVAITWNGHAKWIDYYLYDAVWQREFKKIIYNIIYWLYKLY